MLLFQFFFSFYRFFYLIFNLFNFISPILLYLLLLISFIYFRLNCRVFFLEWLFAMQWRSFLSIWADWFAMQWRSFLSIWADWFLLSFLYLDLLLFILTLSDLFKQMHSFGIECLIRFIFVQQSFCALRNFRYIVYRISIFVIVVH